MVLLRFAANFFISPSCLRDCLCFFNIQWMTLVLWSSPVVILFITSLCSFMSIFRFTTASHKSAIVAHCSSCELRNRSCSSCILGGGPRTRCVFPVPFRLMDKIKFAWEGKSASSLFEGYWSTEVPSYHTIIFALLHLVRVLLRLIAYAMLTYMRRTRLPDPSWKILSPWLQSLSCDRHRNFATLSFFFISVSSGDWWPEFAGDPASVPRAAPGSNPWFSHTAAEGYLRDRSLYQW